MDGRGLCRREAVLDQLVVHVSRHLGHPGGVGLPGALVQQSQRALVGDVLFRDGVVEDRSHAGGLAYCGECSAYSRMSASTVMVIRTSLPPGMLALLPGR